MKREQTEQKIELDLPTSEQISAELKRVKYRIQFRKTVFSTINSLLVVAAIAVLVSMLFLPVLRVTGSSMTPTLQSDELLVCNKYSEYQTGVN